MMQLVRQIASRAISTFLIEDEYLVSLEYYSDVSCDTFKGLHELFIEENLSSLLYLSFES